MLDGSVIIYGYTADISERKKKDTELEFQADLHEYFLGLLSETEITCTNIEQNQWYDRYYLITDADCAIITFHFNANHYYTNAQPQSTKGNEDKKLNHLIEKLRGNL